MDITPAGLEALYYNLVALYERGYQAAPTWTDKVATTVPSSTFENRYPWMKELPRMKEWVGERVLENVSARVYSLLNKDWEDTVAIERNRIEDETWGLYSTVLQALGYQARKWSDDVLTTVIQQGRLKVCFDGQYFFDTDHPVDMDDSSKGTYSNSFTTTPLTPANYATVRQNMQTVLGADGRPLSVNPNLLVVPPQLETTARQILQADFIAPAAAVGGNAASVMQTNTLKGSADLLVIPELSNEATTWYLLDISKPVKPFVWQLRKAPNLVQLTDAKDANVFWKKQFIYGVDARGNGGYSLPFLAARAIA